MLLNWNIIDACFLSSNLHVRSGTAFFFICLASCLLVIALEFLRRLQRNFDRYLKARNDFQQDEGYAAAEEMEEKLLDKGKKTDIPSSLTNQKQCVIFLEQLSRGLIHGLQFAVSYCIMMLFMYSNGIFPSR